MIGVFEQTGWIGFKCVVMSVWSDDQGWKIHGNFPISCPARNKGS